MSTSNAFTAVGVGTEFTLPAGQKCTYALSGTFVGTLGIQKSTNNFQSADDAITLLTTTATTTTLLNDTTKDMQLRWYCSAYTSGTATGIITDVDNLTRTVKNAAGAPVENINSSSVDILVNETIAGSLAETGNQTVTGNVTVTGTETLGGNVALTGDLTGTGNITRTGNEALTGNLTGTGDITRTGNIALTGNITGTGDETRTGNVSITGNLTGTTETLPESASPAETVLGQIVQNSATFEVTVGTGSGRKTLVDTNTAQTMTNKTLTAPVITGANLSRSPGVSAINVFSIGASVVADDLFTIGADLFQVKPLGTDSTSVTAGGSFNNTTNPITIVAATYPGVTFAVGTLIRVTNEIMRATVVGGGNVTLARGVSGTTNAAHADGVAIFKGTALNTGGTIAVGLNATLTPTAFTPALVADINAVGTQSVTASQISVNEVLITANAVGVVTTACSNSTRASNVTAAAAMYGGIAAGDKNWAEQARVPLAVEVTTGKMHFQFGFTPAVVFVQKLTTSGGAAAAWGGTITISGGHVTLTNNATSDYATTHTMLVSASE